MAKLFSAKDYVILEVLIRKCDDFKFKYEKQCQAVLAFSERNKEIIVSFSGTRGQKQLEDQAISIKEHPAVSSAVGGKVQKYFENVHSNFYSEIKKGIEMLLLFLPQYTFKFTGHSLGGAVASITSAMLVKDKVINSDQILLYTFGMPKVGNKMYALAHDRLVPRSWRVVRKGDVVPLLPIPSFTSIMPYHHGIKVLYKDPDMRIDSKYVVCDGKEELSGYDCRAETRRKRGVFEELTRLHTVYFNIPIGSKCSEYFLK